MSYSRISGEALTSKILDLKKDAQTGQLALPLAQGVQDSIYEFIGNNSFSISEKQTALWLVGYLAKHNSISNLDKLEDNIERLLQSEDSDVGIRLIKILLLCDVDLSEKYLSLFNAHLESIASIHQTLSVIKVLAKKNQLQLPLAPSILTQILNELSDEKAPYHDRQACFWILGYVIQHDAFKEYSALLPILEKNLDDTPEIQISTLRLLKIIHTTHPIDNPKLVNMLWMKLHSPNHADLNYLLASLLSALTQKTEHVPLLMDYHEDALTNPALYEQAIIGLKHLSKFRDIFCLTEHEIIVHLNNFALSLTQSALEVLVHNYINKIQDLEQSLSEAHQKILALTIENQELKEKVEKEESLSEPDNHMSPKNSETENMPKKNAPHLFFADETLQEKKNPGIRTRIFNMKNLMNKK